MYILKPVPSQIGLSHVS